MSSEEGFGCGQVLVWRITRSRVIISLSLGSEGLDWKLRSVGKILGRRRTRDGGGGTVSWWMRDPETPSPSSPCYERDRRVPWQGGSGGEDG